MKRIVVPVKHSADSSNIPENAWDLESGTLIRSRLSLSMSSLDEKALFLAGKISKQCGAEIIAVSMGPPSAEETCRRAIALGADKAVLLSDPSFSGSDTLATAMTLAKAVRHILSEKELRETLFICGMQSPDGDTAQVPMQLAVLLGIPVLPYVYGIDFGEKGEILFESLDRRGRAKWTLKNLPALLTVASLSHSDTDFISVERAILASSATIQHLTNRDLELNKTQTGLSGSWTRVSKIFSSNKNGRLGKKISFEVPEQREMLRGFMGELMDFIKKGGSGIGDLKMSEETNSASKSDDAYYSGPFACILERGDSGIIDNSGIELLSKAKTLAMELGEQCVAILCGAPPSGEEISMISISGADRLVHLNANSCKPIAKIVEHLRPQALLIPGTMSGRVLAPMLAAELNAGLSADCTALRIGDFEHSTSSGKKVFSKILIQTRPALGGHIMAEIVSLRGKENNSPQMASVRGGIFKTHKFEPRNIIVEKAPFTSDGEPHGFLKITSIPAPEDSESATDIASCEILVSVGLGIANRQGIANFAVPLADATSSAWGLKTGISASRAAVEAGLLGQKAQVGQTGRTVSPKIYFALGISGAIQHCVGIEKAGRIIAINKDENSPIANFADYFIKGDISSVVPELIRILRIQ